MRPKPYTFWDKLSKYKNTTIGLLAYQKIAKSICQFEDLPMLNIFSSQKSAATLALRDFCLTLGKPGSKQYNKSNTCYVRWWGSAVGIKAPEKSDRKPTWYEGQRA